MRLDALEVVVPAPSPAHRREELRLAGTAMRWWMRMPPRLRRGVVNRLAVSIGLAVNGDELVSKPVWRDAADVELSEIADLFVKNAPTKEQQKAHDLASAEFMGKLRRKAG